MVHLSGSLLENPVLKYYPPGSSSQTVRRTKSLHVVLQNLQTMPNSKKAGGTAKSKARTSSAPVPQKGGSASSVSRKPNVATAMKQAGASSKPMKQAGTSSKSMKQAGTSSSPAVASTEEAASSMKKAPPIASSTWTSVVSLKVAPKRTGARASAKAAPKRTVGGGARGASAKAAPASKAGAGSAAASAKKLLVSKRIHEKFPVSLKDSAPDAARLFLDDFSSDEDVSKDAMVGAAFSKNAHEKIVRGKFDGLLCSVGLSDSQIAEIKQSQEIAVHNSLKKSVLSGEEKIVTTSGTTSGATSGATSPAADEFGGAGAEGFEVLPGATSLLEEWEDFDVALTPDGFDGGFDGDAASMLGMALTPAPGEALTEEDFDSMGIDPPDNFGETPVHPPEEDHYAFPEKDSSGSFFEENNFFEKEDSDSQQILVYSGNDPKLQNNLRKLLVEEGSSSTPLYPSTPAYVSEKAFPSAYVQKALAQYNDWTPKEDYLLAHAVKTQIQRNVMEQVWLCGGPNWVILCAKLSHHIFPVCYGPRRSYYLPLPASKIQECV